MMNELACAAIVALSILMAVVTGCAKLPEDVYTTEDVEITGEITKQYITEKDIPINGFNHVTDVFFYTVIDYGGDNLKIIDDQDYYNRHKVGDKVKLIKHRTYKNGKWEKTTVGLK